MKKSYLAALTALAIAVSGCATNGNFAGLTHTQQGAILGAAGGALVGVATGDNSKERRKRALVGALGGGIAGGGVGYYMDTVKQNFERSLASEIQSGAIRVQKLPNNAVLVTMTEQTAFDYNSAVVKPGFINTINKVAEVNVRYGKTLLTITGHTDSTGSDSYNQRLSEQRAQAVASYFASRGVLPDRMMVYGRGELQPIASNDTEYGRMQNRRVEILVEPIVQQ